MYKNNKTKYLVLACILFIFAGSFIVGHSVSAGVIGDAVVSIVGFIVNIFISLLGRILQLMIWLLIQVAQYNGFIKSPAVTNGWGIVRDLANMFFIVILLIIAFATILRKEEYSYKKLLPKLLIMAVLINFSKTICGIFIDVAQVVMLTFVNGFKELGGPNLSSMLGINEILTMRATESSNASAAEIASLSTTVGSFILALIYILVALVVVTTMLFVLVMRMVMLWIYIVLSPLAYLLAAFPAGQKYSQQWWGEFSKNVIIGPVLAFFIWLSFASVSITSTGSSLLDGQDLVTNAPLVTTSKGGTADSMIKFIISIGMLVGGLMVSQQIGGAAGGIAGKGMGALQKGQGFVTDRAKKRVSDATGYSAAQSYFKQRAEMKEGVRQDKIAGQAAKLGSMVDVARGQTLGRVTGGAKNVWQRFGGAKAKELRAENEKIKPALDQLNNGEGPAYNKIKGAVEARLSSATGNIKHGGNDYYKTTSGEWRQVGGGGAAIAHNDFVKMNADDKAKTVSARLQTSFDDKEAKAVALNKKQKKWDIAGKLGLATVASVVTGGLGGVALGGYMGGRSGLGYLGNKAMAKAGTDTYDGKIASKYKNEKTGKEMDKLKDNSDKDVLAVLSNDSKTVFERMAALLEAMSRKAISEKDAMDHKKKLLGEMGQKGGESMFSDKKLNSKFEAIASKGGYLGATNLFSKAKTDENAKFEIEQAIADGLYKMSDVGAETLKEFIGQFAKTMDEGHFSREYEKMGAGLQKIVVEGLKSSGGKEAKLKLALLADFGELSGTDKNLALGQLTPKQIKDIMTDGSEKQKQELIKAIGKTDANLSNTLKQHLKGTAAPIKDLRSELGLPSLP